ncbi:MAG: nucleoside triphosphate pyrophosphatase [Gammaproteobacteria bacterium]
MSSESIPEYNIVLASNSSIRKKILEDSGIPFEVIPSEVVEEDLKQSLSSDNFKDYCLALAKAKALDVSNKKKNAYVIGSDQICCYEKEIFSKPLTKENCFKTLSKLSGNTHYQNCGISICKDGKEIWSHYAQAALTMKSLSDLEIKDYIDKDEPFMACGAYRFESLGKNLFLSTEGDETTIQGLTLNPILNFLASKKVIDI